MNYFLFSAIFSLGASGICVGYNTLALEGRGVGEGA
jgi:hypothetical protein